MENAEGWLGELGGGKERGKERTEGMGGKERLIYIIMYFYFFIAIEKKLWFGCM